MVVNVIAKLKVHPAIKLTVALVLMLAVSLGQTVHFFIVLLSIIVIYGHFFWQKKMPVLINGLRMLRRLRWFFLSIVLVYGWMGADLANSDSWLSYFYVSWSALQAGFYRIAVIAVFTLTINLLLSTSSRDELIEGLYFLLFPLKLLGLNIGRIVIRIVLVLEKIEGTLLSLDFLKKTQSHHSWFQRVAHTGKDAYCNAISQAQQTKNREIVVTIKKPLILECFFSILLAVFFFIL